MKSRPVKIELRKDTKAKPVMSDNDADDKGSGRSAIMARIAERAKK